VGRAAGVAGAAAVSQAAGDNPGAAAPREAGDMAMTETDHDRIAAAVAAAELKTAGEIYCVLAPAVSDYRETPLAWATAAALILPAGALLLGFQPQTLTALFGGWTVGHAAATDSTILAALTIYVALQAAVFILAALFVAIPPVRRALTPTSLKAERVHRAAMEQFLSHGLHATRDRTGVLLFARLPERPAEVVADERIYKGTDPAAPGRLGRGGRPAERRPEEGQARRRLCCGGRTVGPDPGRPCAAGRRQPERTA